MHLSLFLVSFHCCMIWYFDNGRFFVFFNCFTSIPTALTANDRNRRQGQTLAFKVIAADSQFRSFTVHLLVFGVQDRIPVSLNLYIRTIYCCIFKLYRFKLWIPKVSHTLLLSNYDWPHETFQISDSYFVDYLIYKIHFILIGFKY